MSKYIENWNTLKNSIPNQIQTYYDVNSSTVSVTKSEKSYEQKKQPQPSGNQLNWTINDR